MVLKFLYHLEFIVSKAKVTDSEIVNNCNCQTQSFYQQPNNFDMFGEYCQKTTRWCFFTMVPKTCHYFAVQVNQIIHSSANPQNISRT